MTGQRDAGGTNQYARTFTFTYPAPVFVYTRRTSPLLLLRSVAGEESARRERDAATAAAVVVVAGPHGRLPRPVLYTRRGTFRE